ncbi:MAG: hypothetical protein GX871_08375 [Microbacteriaceae bacterium]|nr:hypothetical protein [Microbacteriaceae bacterium]
MNEKLPEAPVVAHQISYGDERVGVMIAYRCPFCGESHGAAWHSPDSEGGPRFAPCRPFGENEVAIVWPDIPGEVTAALIEYRPDILGRSDVAAWDDENSTPEESEGGPT